MFGVATHQTLTSAGSSAWFERAPLYSNPSSHSAIQHCTCADRPPVAHLEELTLHSSPPPWWWVWGAQCKVSV